MFDPHQVQDAGSSAGRPGLQLVDLVSVEITSRMLATLLDYIRPKLVYWSDLIAGSAETTGGLGRYRRIVQRPGRYDPPFHRALAPEGGPQCRRRGTWASTSSP